MLPGSVTECPLQHLKEAPSASLWEWRMCCLYLREDSWSDGTFSRQNLVRIWLTPRCLWTCTNWGFVQSKGKQLLNQTDVLILFLKTDLSYLEMDAILILPLYTGRHLMWKTHLWDITSRRKRKYTSKIEGHLTNCISYLVCSAPVSMFVRVSH